MKLRTALGISFLVLLLAVIVLLFETWLLGLILSWFGVTLTFWQNFAIIFLANLIFNSGRSSSK